MPRHRSLLACVVVAALSAGTAAAAPALHVAVEQYTLPNGMRVVLHEDHHLPQVVVDTWFRVGSKDEKLKRTGFAHLFEHLMFMGTKNVPNGQFDSIMEAVGGQNNATTSEDRTNYFELGPSNLLETFLWLEADRLSTLADDMTKAKVDLQRDVVKNERRQSYENRPYGKVELVLPEKMFPDGHPYHHPVIGSHEDLTAASVDDVKGFFRQFYVPSNATLVVVGDFQSAQAKPLIEKYFAWMGKQPEPPHAAARAAHLAKGEHLTLTDAVKLPRVVMAWHSPEQYGPGDADCDLLAALLGAGKSSRLYRALVYDKKVAQQVQVEQRSMRHGGLFVITATAQPGHSAAEIEKAIDDELAKLAAQPPTDREVERARAFVQTTLLRSIESPIGLADALAGFDFRFGDASQIDQQLLPRYEGRSAKQVASEAHTVLGQPHLTLQVVPR